MALVKYNNNSISSVTSAAGFPAGAMTLIKTLTASSSSTLSFVNGSSDVVLDNTYPIYLFKFINIHPANDDKHFLFNGSDDTSSHSYDITKTTTSFAAYHNEGGSDSAVAYQTGGDLAQSTAFQPLSIGDKMGNDNDQGLSGLLHLFNPSSTTFVKHFIAKTSIAGASNYNSHAFFAGYFNTTSAITAIQFKAETGSIDSGTIKLYGIKDS